jgi:uncharacterized FlaG/YvyC family protein
MDVSAIASLSTPRVIHNESLAGTVYQPPKTDVMKTKPPVSIDVVLGDLSRVSAAFNKRLSFRMNEKLDQVVVKVIDTQTDKVIKEIPPAELQHVHERIREVIGLLYDEHI